MQSMGSACSLLVVLSIANYAKIRNIRYRKNVAFETRYMVVDKKKHVTDWNAVRQLSNSPLLQCQDNSWQHKMQRNLLHMD